MRNVKDLKIRLDEADYEALRTVSYCSSTSMNEIASTAIRSFLSGVGSKEVSTARAAVAKRYQSTVDKLSGRTQK